MTESTAKLHIEEAQRLASEGWSISEIYREFIRRGIVNVCGYPYTFRQLHYWINNAKIGSVIRIRHRPYLRDKTVADHIREISTRRCGPVASLHYIETIMGRRYGSRP